MVSVNSGLDSVGIEYMVVVAFYVIVTLWSCS